MDIGELVAKSNKDFKKVKCPFCNKADCKVNEDKVNINNIKSIPKNLGDVDLDPAQKKGAYGRARHHMIPAKQCYKKLHRIATMGEKAGYDINNKKNGIPLPTVWNPYKVNNKDVNFGKIVTSDGKTPDETEKNKIRDSAMKATKAQWHVGHHHYDAPNNEEETENMGDEGILDHECYDAAVLGDLLDLSDKTVSENLCNNGSDGQNKIITMLDKLCKKIETDLNKFAKLPKGSKKYFVSKVAMSYQGKTKLV